MSWTPSSTSSADRSSSSMRRSTAKEMPSRAIAIRPSVDAARDLDGLQREAVREPDRIRDAIVARPDSDRGLHEPDVAGPERHDRRDVHEDEDEPGGGERRIAAERLHRDVHREELHEPARRCRSTAPASGTGALSTESPCRPMLTSWRAGAHPLAHDRPVVPLGPEPRNREEREAHGGRDRDRNDRPMRHLRRQQHPHDEDRRRNEVEQAVRNDRADEGRARPRRRVPQVAAAAWRRARALAGPTRDDGVPRASRPRTRTARGRASAGARAGSACPTVRRHDRARKSVETTLSRNARTMQLQMTTLERVEDRSPVRTAPPDDDEREHQRGESRRALRPPGAPHAAAPLSCGVSLPDGRSR